MIDSILATIAKGLLRLRYRVHLEGLEPIARRGRERILILPNHPALIDPILLAVYLRGPLAPRFLADEDQMDRFFIGWMGKRWGVHTMPDLAGHGPGAREDVQAAIDQCIEWLREGQNVVLYPSGHLMRTRLENLRGNSSADRIIKEVPDARIVLVRTRGLWGSRFSWGLGREPKVGPTLRQGAVELLKSFAFFAPKREVTIEFAEPDDLPREGSREEINRYLQDFYNADPPHNTYVPRTLWEEGETRTIPEPPQRQASGDLGEVPQGTRQIVTEKLRDMSGVSQIDDGDQLARDLGLDSLARAELLVWLQEQFGVTAPGTESLYTVSDVLLAACGEPLGGGEVSMESVPSQWFVPDEDGTRAGVPEGETLTELFLQQVRENPDRPVVADQRSGVRTFRDVVRATLALKPAIERIEGDYAGILLPAGVAATVTYMATLFAGKTPVMVNWTAGLGSIIASLNRVGVDTVLTSRELVGRLGHQGIELGELEDRFVYLEDIRASLTWGDKLGVWLRSLGSLKSLKNAPVRERAVVLFTSGSETQPKAVPLTHANILANLRDIADAVHLRRSDVVLGILPPFHSFGLMVGVVVPLCAAIRVAYHPNPNEAAVLAHVVEAYGASLAVGTPTFLSGMARAAEEDQLRSVRIAVAGAEACPKRAYETMEEAMPNATIMEGYGITECSPIVSVNDPDDPRRFSIGRPLPSVETAVVHPETRQPVEPGETGELLVRGPNVFDGYIGDVGGDPFVEYDGKQWYDTGDLVKQDEKGVLVFQGRLKRFEKIGGEMVSLPAIEQAVRDSFEIEATGDPQVAVLSTGGGEGRPELVLVTTLEVSREQANRAVKEAGLSGLHNIQRVRQVEEIPQLGTGKTDYRSLEENLRT